MHVPIGTSSRADASLAARKASRIHSSWSSSCAPCSSENISFKQRNSDYRFRKNDSQGRPFRWICGEDEAQASSLALLLRPATETIALQSNQCFEIRAPPLI